MAEQGTAAQVNTSLMSTGDISIYFIENIKNNAFFMDLIKLQSKIRNPNNFDEDYATMASRFIDSFCALDMRIEGTFSKELNEKANIIRQFLTSRKNEELNDVRICAMVRDYGRAYGMLLQESNLDNLTLQRSATLVDMLENPLLKNE